ncbi:MAG: Pyrrolidone-carboxylate peptidase [Betaproteobacteria bacterium]|nr:Pyrrolidone-carboxylate peptidase [Betaproteobacteria bacterium]
MRALVTGFESFGGAASNASYEAVRRLPSRAGNVDIVTAQLPTAYARAGATLIGEIRRADPDLVLCVGEANERTALNIERVAINVQDARLADNDGAQPRDMPVIAGGPAAYFSTLPVRTIYDALIAARLPATLSNTAGAFVCNHAFYTLMHFAAESTVKWRGGFLHVPAWRDGQPADAMPALTLDDIVRGIVITLETSAQIITS